MKDENNEKINDTANQQAKDDKESSEINYDTASGTKETHIIKTEAQSGMGVKFVSDLTSSETPSSEPTSATKILNRLVDMVADINEHGEPDFAVIISNATRILSELPKQVIAPDAKIDVFKNDDFDVMYEIGRGAMGSVYKCYQRSLQRIVAVKVLSKKWAENPNFYKMLINEARMAAQLNHPNIVQVYSIASDGEKDFMVMEYVKGVPLSKVLAGHPKGIKPSLAYFYAMQVAEALQAAHTKHVIHRDIKPDNILVLPEDRIKVTDFGIACHLDSFNAIGPKYRAGTPAFMSPEQTRGEPLDGRSDIFSLGIVLYNMLTGIQPFQGDTLEDTLSKVSKNVVFHELEINPIIPQESIPILKKALSTDPAKRYQSAEAIKRDLERATLKAKIAEDEKKEIKYKPPKKYPFYIAGIALFIALFFFVKYYNDIFSNTTRSEVKNQVEYMRNQITEQTYFIQHHFPYEKEREYKAILTVLDGRLRTNSQGRIINYTTQMQQQINITNLQTYIKILKGINEKSDTTQDQKKRISDFIKEVVDPETNDIKDKYKNTYDKINYFNRIALEIIMDCFPKEEIIEKDVQTDEQE